MKKFVLGLLLLVCTGALVLAGGGKASSGSGSAAPGPVEITVEVFDRGTDGGKSDPTNNNWTKWIQEKLFKDENIVVKFVAVPRSNEVPTLNNLMASNSAPDICFSYDLNAIANFVQLGGLYDMGPQIDTTLNELKAFLGPDPSIPGRDLIRRNQEGNTGKIYSIPARRALTGTSVTFIRKDWLDKLGLPVPKTKEEFFNTLVAFKERDPGNVGKDRIIPFIMHNTPSSNNLIMHSFLDVNVSPRDRWINNAGSLFTLPGFKEGVRYMNRMFNAGLIDRDFPLYNSNAEMFDRIKTGWVGSFQELWNRPWDFNVYRIVPDLQANVPGAQLIAIDCFENSAGVTVKECDDIAGVNFFIPNISKNPEAAMRYVNWLSRLENIKFLQFGNEGVNHDLVNGLPAFKAAIGPWIQNSGFNLDYTLPINGVLWEDGSTEMSLRVEALGRIQGDPAVYIDAYRIAMNNAKPEPIIQPSSPLTAFGPVSQTLADKSKVFLTELITSPSAQFDRHWETGLTDWLSSGAQAVIDERRAKYIAP
jgi:putative aldouronate transport system substrate-binding protein